MTEEIMKLIGVFVILLPLIVKFLRFNKKSNKITILNHLQFLKKYCFKTDNNNILIGPDPAVYIKKMPKFKKIKGINK